MGFTPDALQQMFAAQQANLAAEKLYISGENKIAQQETAEQVETQRDLKASYEALVNPLAAKFVDDEKNIKERRINLNRVQKKDESVLTGSKREIQDEASKFEKRNSELKSQILLLLLSKAKDCRDKDELLKLLNQFYPDPTLADEALDFLLETTRGTLQEIVKQAKEELQEKKGREIQAGKNINAEVQKYASSGLGTTNKLRDLYRDITGNPRDPIQLFLELGDRFAYKDLRKVLAYLFHSLGTDLKSQGPSIPAGLLHRLLTEIRNLQAGLGILHFFRNRMRLIEYLFEKNNLLLPTTINFETISKQFILFLQERYPSSDKILQLANRLGFHKELMAKIIILSQMRDAVREIALYQFYRSIHHRDEILKAIMDALEELEDELDELLEREYDEDEDKDEDKDEDEEEDKDNDKKQSLQKKKGG